MTEAPSAERRVRRARQAAEQFRALCRVLGLIHPLLSRTAEHAALETRSRSLAAGFNGLVLLDGPPMEEALRKLEAGVQQLERELEALDARIPMSWFRQHFDASQASSVALADYATLLGRAAGDDPSRLDRVQFLLTRLVHFFVSADQDSPELRRQLLAEALPSPTLPAQTRRTVVTFCHDAVQRLETFTRLGDLIGSRFFADVRSYKESLRQQLLDPDVMTAVIELNEATSETLDRLARAEQVQGRALEQHLVEVDLRIKSLFQQLRVDESAKTQQFEAWLAQGASAPKPSPHRGPVPSAPAAPSRAAPTAPPAALPAPAAPRRSPPVAGKRTLILAVVALVLLLLLLLSWGLGS